MNDSNKYALAALVSVEGVGLRTLRRVEQTLRKHEVDWVDFWVHFEELVALFTLKEKQIISIKKALNEHLYEKVIKNCQNHDVRLVVEDDLEYPSLLKQIDSKPMLVFVKGASLTTAIQQPIAIIGTRQITSYGKMVCKQLVPDLVHAGCSIISGFMYGVDSYAHQLAIDTGGYTVGVLGYGFDHIFPLSNKYLFESMLANNGSFISEFPFNTPALPANFPIRNRIVAGMSVATVVIEAAAESGSHITANYAVEFGRTVCAVPGPITNMYSDGTKALINQGAVLVNSAADIISEIGYTSSPSAHSLYVPQNERERSLLALLQETEQSYDSLCETLHLSTQELNILLTNLEMQNVIARTGTMVCLYMK